jgi:hypothetical protein
MNSKAIYRRKLNSIIHTAPENDRNDGEKKKIGFIQVFFYAELL